MPNTLIIGSGSYIPERVVNSSEFLDSIFFDENLQRIDKPSSEIVNKFIEITEIENRRYAHENETSSEMGAKAAKIAIEDAKMDKESLDYIIYASNFGEVTKDGIPDFMPNMAGRLKHKLGIENLNCVTYDMIFGCPGWVEAMILADTIIKSGKGKNILVVGSEMLSRVVDPYDRDKMIFADGAAAVVVTATDRKDVGVLASNTLCFNGDELAFLGTGCSLNPENKKERLYIRMKGRKIYEFVLKNVPSAIKKTIEDAGLGLADIEKILLHQANAKMDHAIVARLYRLFGIKEYDDNIAPMTIQNFGNSSVATVPTMFDLIRKGNMEGHHFSPRGNIVLASVGAGMNINAFVYRFE